MKKILPIILLAFLQACSHAPKKVEPPKEVVSATPKQAASTFEQHQKKLAQVNNWKAEGRMAITRGAKGNNANFVWEQNGDNFDIKIFGPFGSGAVYITGNDNQVQMKEANGKTHTARTPEELLQKVAGWQVPLTGLRYWIRGIPTPKGKMASHQINGTGCLTHLQQDGWNIQYQEYAANAVVPLPNKLELQNPKLKVKMVIKSWQV